MEETNSNRTYEIVGGVIVLVVLLVLCVWLLVRHHQSAMSGAMATSTSETATSTAATTTAAATSAIPESPTEVVSGDMVSASDQPAGMSATVASVTVGQRTWVAIKNSTGTILGAALVPAGTHANVTVPLLRGTVAGQMYEAILYVDAGDKVFDLHTDTLVMSSDGAAVSAGFNAR